jgi:hypothetical protein
MRLYCSIHHLSYLGPVAEIRSEGSALQYGIDEQAVTNRLSEEDLSLSRSWHAPTGLCCRKLSPFASLLDDEFGSRFRPVGAVSIACFAATSNRRKPSEGMVRLDYVREMAYNSCSQLAWDTLTEE